jgi:methylated-DNA-protein-cysteine methyltransferase-like protein
MLIGKMMFSYPRQMQEFLEAEGVRVENDRVVEFGTVFWSPE